MNNKYRIELTPLDNFFFGGEITFGEGKEPNYFARSNRFPQQTSLLGMLRFEVLKTKKLLPVTDINKEDVSKIIGDKGFRFEENTTSFKFGIIQSISPAFIFKKENSVKQDYMVAPFDCGYKVDFETSRVYLSGKQKKNLINCDNFNHKDYKTKRFLGIDKYDEIFESEIFKSHVKTGINTLKNRETGNDEKCLYRQEFIRMDKGYGFVFYAELSEDIFKDKSIREISLGAEGSMFSMRIEKLQQEDMWFDKFNGILKKYDCKNKMVLLSDAYVEQMATEPSVFELCDFIWGESVCFRNIETKVNNVENNYANYPKKSAKRFLLQKGSVLYCQDNKDDVLQLLANPHLQKCGFNIIII
jgi:CRISPR type III-B/RAMP module-associated protein Cmr3